jgi:hypothetical protein
LGITQALFFRGLYPKIPEHYSGRDGNIQGVFGAQLRYFNHALAFIYNLLRDTFHLMTQDKGIGLTGFGLKFIQGNRALRLFHGPYLVGIPKGV